MQEVAAVALSVVPALPVRRPVSPPSSETSPKSFADAIAAGWTIKGEVTTMPKRGRRIGVLTLVHEGTSTRLVIGYVATQKVYRFDPPQAIQ